MRFVSPILSQIGFVGLASLAMSAWAGDPWADRVAFYDRGDSPAGFLTDPTTAIGSPERFTGEGSFPGAVTMFNPPFGADEIVRIGRGGALVLEFNEPITDDAAHPFGVDFIVFGNGGFIDVDYPNGRIDGSATIFGLDPMRVSVSGDGVDFVTLGEFSEGLFPTQGYADVAPFDAPPGSVPTDFTRPMNPSLTQADFAGLTYAEALGLYAGSGGGTPIDIAVSGLTAVRFVKIEAIDTGDDDVAVEIDAIATVPEPGAALAVLLLGGLALRRRALRRA